ncbi:MAG: histidine kinase [Nitrospiraceae bacterium]
MAATTAKRDRAHRRSRGKGLPGTTRSRSSARAAAALLMEIFATDPLVRIVGVAEINPNAPGLGLAKRLKIPVTRNYRRLLSLERINLVIDVSGNAEIGEYLMDFHRMGVTVIGGASAKFMWRLIKARIRATAEIEKTLNKYQSLYRLYVKETGAAVTEERTRIACEIHDGLVQSLAGVNFKLELCRTTPERPEGKSCDVAWTKRN